MNCIKRAVCYIYRKKVKSLLLLFIFLVSEVTILGTLSILDTSVQIKDKVFQQTNAKVRAESLDLKKGITDKEIRELSKMKNVNFVNRAGKITVVANSFAPIPGGDEDTSGKVDLQGYDDLEKDGPFVENICRLTEGTLPNKDREIVINQFLAEANHIRIGDKISFISKQDKTITAIVTGLFRSGNERQQTDNVTTINRIENQFYTMTSFIDEFEHINFEAAMVYVDKPDKLDETAKQMEQLLDNEAEISTNDAYYQKMKYSMLQVGRVAKLIFALTVITSIFIIFMLLIMWMRNRKVEMAVFISMGISKTEVFVQMLAEILAVYSVGSILAGGIFAVCTPILSKMMGSIDEVNLIISPSIKNVWIVWVTGIFVLTGVTFFAMLPNLQKKIKDTLSEMEG